MQQMVLPTLLIFAQMKQTRMLCMLLTETVASFGNVPMASSTSTVVRVGFILIEFRWSAIGQQTQAVILQQVKWHFVYFCIYFGIRIIRLIIA